MLESTRPLRISGSRITVLLLWRPAALGIRPRYESDAMKRYLAGGYTGNEKEQA